MTCYSFSQLQDIWTSNGGSALTAPMAAAISMAESGGCSDRTSPAGDVGLWQINKGYWGPLATYDPNGNARAAVQISGNGSNWHPWCTAYADGACGKKGGAFLGAGSPFQKFLSGGAITAGQGVTGGGQTGSGSPQGQPQQSSSDDCAINLAPKINLGIYTQSLPSACLWHNGWSRAVIGGLMFAGALSLGIAGAFLMLNKSPTFKAAMKDVGGLVKKSAEVAILA